LYVEPQLIQCSLFLFLFICCEETSQASTIDIEINCQNLLPLVIELLELCGDRKPLQGFDPTLVLHPSASATFYASSDVSGIGGMHQEVIHTVAQWQKGVGQYDTVLTKLNNGESGMCAFSVGHL
jgi:hypothetical protein